MSDEEIIRTEANLFHDGQLGVDGDLFDPLEILNEIKEALEKFYSPDSKAIFLDEFSHLLSKDLVVHRKEQHGGKPGKDCPYEIDAERLAFYIRQEISILPAIVHASSKKSSKSKRTRVFVCYSHLDKEYVDDIKRYFKPFSKEIDFWDDSRIKPGQIWKAEIFKAIEEAKVAILLVSTDFLGSEFIAQHEVPLILKAAKNDGASILIITLDPCMIDEFPELSQFQAMNPPDKPVVKMDRIERGDLFVNLVRQTKHVLEGSQ